MDSANDEAKKKPQRKKNIKRICLQFFFLFFCFLLYAQTSYGPDLRQPQLKIKNFTKKKKT